jgi:hypothetical protein
VLFVPEDGIDRMSSLTSLLPRIRAEYEALPGLKLTPAQACGLWGVSEDICGHALDLLIEEGLLRRTATGAYVALPSPGGAALKDENTPPSFGSALRCPHCLKLQAVPAPDGHVASSFRCEACQRIVNIASASA